MEQDKTKVVDHAELMAIELHQWRHVTATDAGGGLYARMLKKGPMFYWRGRDGGKLVPVPLGMYDPAAAPRGKKPTAAGGLSIEAAKAAAAAVAAQVADAARRGTSRTAEAAQARTEAQAAEEQRKSTQRAQRAEAAGRGTKVADAWKAYLKERKPHWGDRHYADHVRMALPGGEKATRGTRGRGVTIAGPLHSLMGLRLRDLTGERVEQWAAVEAKTRATRARLALRHLRAFLNWCAEHKTYGRIVSDAKAAKTKKAREALGEAGAGEDALQKQQLPAWFAAVRALDNVPARTYLQIMLLTGARPGEVLDMAWKDVDEKWRSIVLRDKIEGDRVIPLTPYVGHLLASLPRRGEFVFASPVIDKGEKTPRMSEAHGPLARACAAAGVDHLTIHGLRRSFGTLSEWLELPAGVVAQIMGHKPNATAEKHYRVRPIDLLHVYHEKFERWILESAGIEFDPEPEASDEAKPQPAKTQSPKLRLVA